MEGAGWREQGGGSREEGAERREQDEGSRVDLAGPKLHLIFIQFNQFDKMFQSCFSLYFRQEMAASIR